VFASRARPGYRFGSPPRAARPIVLLIVFGLFLVIVGVTTTAQTILVSAHFSNSALNEIVASDAATVRTFVNMDLLESDLIDSPATSARRAALTTDLDALIRNGNLLHLEIRRPDGTIVASEDQTVVGRIGPQSADFAVALGGSVAPAFVDAAGSNEAAAPLAPPTTLREYLPLMVDGSVRAVVGVWRDAAPVLRAMDDVRRQVVIVTVAGALIAAVLLFLVFRGAQNRINRQARDLVESTRRDPVTGLMNHGALLATLAGGIETARAASEPIGVAVIDIDGFRLLNDTYGHEAGDVALRRVASRLVRTFGDDTLGRYGPDEFLVVVDGPRVGSLEHDLGWLRAALADEALEFESSERLPITVSAGIGTYPADADSVTELLGAAAQALAEARASGGDAVRVAGRAPAASPDAKAFDIFHGLILAVDTKDRYTKRHCEDVARYSVFLARRLGLPDEIVSTIRVAGLLHDVGKIGVPDALLRRPGRLTADEYRVVKQHVALGDLIVRDLPNIELIRAGVRHHHERWDGRGYLDELAGDEIPLVARILAVGDAFSAMTTTRPYRKAMPLEEALRRLEDASGTQLEESLVRTFVEGMQTEADAPMPGLAEAAASQLWTPSGLVA
jgi:diguanylate cyclase (GGDEF)-like protein